MPEFLGTHRTSDELLARLNEAQHSAHIGSWNWNMLTGEVWWSDELYRIFDLSPEHFQPTFEGNAKYVHPDDVDAYHKAVERVIREGGVLNYDLRIVTQQGTLKYCNSRGQIEYDESGKPIRFFGTFHDITDRKQAQAALQESEARYRQIVETAQEGIWQIDERSVTIFVNGRMAEMLGYSREEMLGASLFDFIGDRSKSIAETNLERRRQGLSEQHEFVFRRKDGQELWALLSTNPIFDAVGRYAGALAMVMDITERHQVETALRLSDARFRQLTASLPQMVWTCTDTGACDYLSERWEEFTGRRADEQLELAWLEQIHPDDHDRVVAEWRAAVERGVEFRSEFRIRRRDGVYRWFDTRAIPLIDEHGRAVRWVGSNTDIDERRRAHEWQLRTQKMEALGTLAGGIAHDFNNILLAISGNAKLAIGDLAADHPARTSVLEIARASARAADLVRRILAFSRQEEPKREVIDMRPVSEEALKLLRPTLPAMIELRVNFAADLPLVSADATQVHQAIMNLATNAAHAIGERAGVIELRLDTVDVGAERADQVPGLREGRYVRLSIRDTGTGISKSTLERIFDPFFTTKPAGEGTGLGLSVVDGIVKSHGGAISVQSELSVGTTFDLYFPAAQASASPRSAEHTPSETGSGERILYVDDDEALVFLTQRIMTKMGYTMTGHTDPTLALAHFEAHPTEFDLIVTDLSMPKMSGFELARAFRAIRAEVPIVLTSGYVRAQDQEAANQLGIRALILKPNTVEELGAVLQRILREK